MDLIVVAVIFIIGYLSVSQTFMFCSWVKAVQKVVWDQHGKLPHIIYHIIASLFSQRTFSSLCNAIALCRLGKFLLLLMQKKKKRNISVWVIGSLNQLSCLSVTFLDTVTILCCGLRWTEPAQHKMSMDSSLGGWFETQTHDL